MPKCVSATSPSSVSVVINLVDDENDEGKSTRHFFGGVEMMYGKASDIADDLWGPDFAYAEFDWRWRGETLAKVR